MPEASALTNLSWITRLKAIAGWSNAEDAERWGVGGRAPAEALRVFKTALGAGTSTALGSYGGVGISQWIDSAQTANAVYRLLADNAVRRCPLQTRCAITSGATAAVVAEGYATPLSAVSVEIVCLAPLKVVGLTVETNELLREIGAAGQIALNKQLLGALAPAVDSAFLDLVTSTGTPSTASTGNTAVDAHRDLRTAALSVTAGNAVGNAKLYFICAPDVAVMASTLCDTAGAPAFPTMRTDGGELAGRPVIVSSGVDPGELIMIDAASIAADAGMASVDTFSQGDVLMNTVPLMDVIVPTAAQLVSLWQNNLTALCPWTLLGAQALRDDAVHITTGIDWGA